MRVKTENGIRLVRIIGSVWNRGFYPVFEREQEAPKGVELWFEPQSQTVSLSHPGKLAIPLYNRRSVSCFVNSDDLVRSRIVNVPDKTKLSEETQESIGSLYKLKASEQEPLEWISWAKKSGIIHEEPQVILDMTSGNENISDRDLYALRRYSSSKLQEIVEVVYSVKSQARHIYLWTAIVIICQTFLVIYKEAFIPNYDFILLVANRLIFAGTLYVGISLAFYFVASFARSSVDLGEGVSLKSIGK